MNDPYRLDAIPQGMELASIPVSEYDRFVLRRRLIDDAAAKSQELFDYLVKFKNQREPQTLEASSLWC